MPEKEFKNFEEEKAAKLDPTSKYFDLRWDGGDHITPELVEKAKTIFRTRYCSSCENFAEKQYDCDKFDPNYVGECNNYSFQKYEGPFYDEVRGKRVRIKDDFLHVISSDLRKDSKEIEGTMTDEEIKQMMNESSIKMSDNIPYTVSIPKNSEGTIDHNDQTLSIYILSEEWPVRFDLFTEKGLDGLALGIPHEYLEFVDDE